MATDQIDALTRLRQYLVQERRDDLLAAAKAISNRPLGGLMENSDRLWLRGILERMAGIQATIAAIDEVIQSEEELQRVRQTERQHSSS